MAIIDKTLTVFDIQRFALHDGPGIRTTVFLKGCPLDCLWCHNPESKKSRPQLGLLRKNCVGCGKCASVCEKGVHSFTADGSHEVDFELCDACGECVKACPNSALKIYGKPMTVKDILKTVVRDRDFYDRSGGGLTVSGGEPMAQFEGLKVLLEAAKESGIHVCLDTSGQAATEKYAAIAPYVDLFLFDYKLTDPDTHRIYTGADNSLILKNLDYLCRSGSKVFLRCPIIPGVNNDDLHYRGIAELSRKYDGIVQVNLMTYHDMAKGKAEQIGERYALPEIKTIANDEKKLIYDKVAALG